MSKPVASNAFNNIAVRRMCSKNVIVDGNPTNLIDVTLFLF